MMISPSLRVSQGPPNPFQNALPGVGPRTVAPVALSNTSKVTFTHWTNCVAPTAPLVSGGTNGPPLATVSGRALRPSKFKPIPTFSPAPDTVLATGSDCSEVNGDRVGWASGACVGPLDCAGITTWCNGPERSCFSSCVTMGFATAKIGTTAIPIRQIARSAHAIL